MSNNNFLEARNITKVFSQQSGIFKNSKTVTRAVENVSFNIFESESFGLVGETGSGKSTLGRCLIRLSQPDRGQVIYDNVNLTGLSAGDFRRYRSKLQMIFQHPGQSLNPVYSVRHTLSEPLRALKIIPLTIIPERLEQLLSAVGLENIILNHLPHQLSGGQKQRVVIARALAVNPSFIIADEPTSSVDSSMKRQILDLIKNIRSQFGLTILLISHDLEVVAYATDRMAVMYNGRLLEIAPTKTIMQQPGHPYSQQLIRSSRLKLNINEHSDKIQPGQVDTAYPGCGFITGCPYAKKLCQTKIPELQHCGDGRFVACHFPEKLLA